MFSVTWSTVGPWQPAKLVAATAACSGPCGPTVWDYLGYVGLILLALGAIGLVYGIARLLAASGRIGSWIVPLLTVGATTLALVIVASRFPQPTVVPSRLTVGLRGIGSTDSFYLRGNYEVTWDADPLGSPTCNLEASLYRADNNAKVSDLVAVVVKEARQGGEAAPLSGLPGAEYFVKASSDCDWNVTLDGPQ